MPQSPTGAGAEEFALGRIAPDCALPDGSWLHELRGQPVILAFAPEEWNPGHAYESEIFAQLAREFDSGVAFVDTAAGEWHALPAGGALAATFGFAGKRGLILIDEDGAMQWRVEVEPGEAIQPGEIIAALEALRPVPRAGGRLSRRAFLSATLAAAVLLALPLPEMGSSRADPLALGTTASSDAALAGPNPAGTMRIGLNVNGRTRQLQIEPRVALLDALRENLHLTGTKKGCDHGQCGACTVHIDGVRALSCLTLAVMNQGKKITTIEGLASGENLHPLQTAFIKHDAFQCGYCTPGQIMSGVAVLNEGRAHSDAEIREAMSGNLCRCAAYPNIIAAIRETSGA